MPINTPRAQIARFVREKIEGEDRVDLPDLVEMAVGHFAHDPAFVAQFMREAFPAIIYGIAQNVVAQTRGATVLVGNTLTTTSAARKAASAARPRWQMWLEHTGAGFARLPDMTREELLTAAEQRDTRADRERSLATLWRTLAFNLAPGQKVGDFYDDAAIDAVVDALSGGVPGAGVAAGAAHGLTTGQLPRQVAAPSGE